MSTFIHSFNSKVRLTFELTVGGTLTFHAGLCLNPPMPTSYSHPYCPTLKHRFPQRRGFTTYSIIIQAKTRHGKVCFFFQLLGVKTNQMYSRPSSFRDSNLTSSSGMTCCLLYFFLFITMLPYTRMSLNRKNWRALGFFRHIFVRTPSPTRTLPCSARD